MGKERCYLESLKGPCLQAFLEHVAHSFGVVNLRLKVFVLVLKLKGVQRQTDTAELH